MKKFLFLATVLISQNILSQKQKYDLVFKNVNIVSMENDKVLLNQIALDQLGAKSQFLKFHYLYV